MPGAPPGIYACAYRPLAAILALLAEARLASASGNYTGAEVPDILVPCEQQPVVRALHVNANTMLLQCPLALRACVKIRIRGGACCMTAQVVARRWQAAALCVAGLCRAASSLLAGRLSWLRAAVIPVAFALCAGELAGGGGRGGSHGLHGARATVRARAALPRLCAPARRPACRCASGACQTATLFDVWGMNGGPK